MTKTGTTGGAASSGYDQAQERARSRGRTLHAMEDRTFRLAEKVSSCGQKMGHRRQKIGDGRGNNRYQKRRLERRSRSQVPKNR